MGSTDVSDTDIGAIAIGAKVAYIIPNQHTPMATYVEGFLSPKITSFGDTDSFYEFSAGFEVELAPSAKGYLGYRFMEAEFEGASEELEIDNRLHVGLQFTF